MLKLWNLICETFEKCDIFSSGKDAENLNQMDTLGILRLKFEA